MFQITELTEAKLCSVTNRVERHGDDEVPAVSLSLEIEAENTLLDNIDPQIRAALYKAVDGQDELPGVDPATPVLRCNSFEKVTLTTAHEGWTLAVDDTIDDSDPMTFGGCKVDKFTVDAKQGGSILLRFRVGTSDVDADKLGALAMHNGQAIWVTVKPPEKAADVIDGSVEAFRADHPDATDLFAADGAVDTPGGDDLDEVGDGAPADLEDVLDAALTAGDERPAEVDAAEFEAGAAAAIAKAKPAQRQRRAGAVS